MIELLLAAVHAAPAGFGGPAEMWASIVKDFSNITEPAAFSAFLQVLMIDLVLAGDNAIVVGALAAGLPAAQRRKVIILGVIAALVLRIFFALIVTQLLQIVGLILVGGVLLLWVAWKMWRELNHSGEGESGGSPEVQGDERSGIRPAKSFAGAAWAVAVADVSMSLDNVLAVAGAAREHPGILIVGLIFAVGADGHRRQHHRQIYRALPVDRLHRPGGDPVGRGQDDARGLGRSAGGPGHACSHDPVARTGRPKRQTAARRGRYHCRLVERAAASGGRDYPHERAARGGDARSADRSGAPAAAASRTAAIGGSGRAASRSTTPWSCDSPRRHRRRARMWWNINAMAGERWSSGCLRRWPRRTARGSPSRASSPGGRWPMGGST